MGAKCLQADSSFMGGLSLFWGFGDPVEEKMVRCMREGLPFLHLDHAYFKRGYEHGNVRVNFGHFHATRLLDVPGDRAGLARKRLEPWREGRHIVLVSPSERICRVLAQVRGIPANAKDWVRQAESKLREYTSRPIVVKEKGGSFLDAIKGAHAVVSLSSVAEVEAAVHGVPVFVTQDSPAAAVGLLDWSRIESPIYPDRDAWLRSLSYSQFHVSEFAGTTRKIIEGLYGDFYLQRATDGGSKLA